MTVQSFPASRPVIAAVPGAAGLVPDGYAVGFGVGEGAVGLAGREDAGPDRRAEGPGWPSPVAWLGAEQRAWLRDVTVKKLRLALTALAMTPLTGPSGSATGRWTRPLRPARRSYDR